MKVRVLPGPQKQLIMKHFVEFDKLDGEWLSPVLTEREWQEQKLVEIFGHYPNASPKWQYMNGLIHIALEHLKEKN